VSGGFVKGPEREVCRGKVVALHVGQFTGPGGEEFERDIVRHPGAVAVVPVLDTAGTPEAVLLRQYRPALDQLLLEVPAGKRDVADEAPEVTAERELAEEVGLRAGRLVKLAEFVNSPGFSDELSHVFLALDLDDVDSNLQGVEEQHMTVERVALADVPALVAAGDLIDAKSIIGLLLARQHLGIR
jgi:ADP-ribose pyrophosphatase